MVLMSDSLIDFYWIGFLLADGYINHQKRCLRLCLQNRDKHHLEKLHNYLNLKGKISSSIVKNREYNYFSMSSRLILDFVTKFNFKQQKTYNPPDTLYYDKFTNDQIMSLFIGIIDADGNIQNQYKRKDTAISIQTHKSWKVFFEYIQSRLNLTGNIHILKSGYLKWVIGCIKTQQNIKQFSLDNNLPILERKWSKIDLNFIHKKDKKDLLLTKIQTLRQNMTLIEISKFIKIPYNTICYHLYNKGQKHDRSSNENKL